jgi:hypothetical protein
LNKLFPSTDIFPFRQANIACWGGVGIDIAYKKTMVSFTGKVYPENHHETQDLLKYFTHYPQFGILIGGF